MHTKTLRNMSRAWNPRLRAGSLVVVRSLIVVYAIVPFVWAFISSIKPSEELFATPVRYWPANPTLENYRLVLGSCAFRQALWNSVVVALSVTGTCLFLGSSAAYALGRFRFRGRSVVFYSVLAMTMFPQIAILGALFQLINAFGLYNRLPALVVSYLLFTLPFTVWTITNFLQAVPAEIEEAAYLDGASPWQIYSRVMLPLARPGMVVAGVMAFIAAWNEFLFALSFTQTPEKRTVTYAIQAFSTSTSGMFEIPWGQMTAASVLVTVPPIVLTFIFQRSIIDGLTSGAVKG